MKTCIFQNLVFPKTSLNTKLDILNSLKHSVYGYDPLHNQDEISMFLTISINLVLVERCKHEYQKPNMYFSKRKSFVKTKLSRVCV